jgi:hypothetical protein
MTHAMLARKPLCATNPRRGPGLCRCHRREIEEKDELWTRIGSISYPQSHTSTLPESSGKHPGTGHARRGPTTTAVSDTVEAVTVTVAAVAAVAAERWR